MEKVELFGQPNAHTYTHYSQMPDLFLRDTSHFPISNYRAFSVCESASIL